jgi:hypothetical protein
MYGQSSRAPGDWLADSGHSPLVCRGRRPARKRRRLGRCQPAYTAAALTVARSSPAARTPAASQARGSELVSALIAEHRELAGLVARLQAPVGGTDAASTAESIATLFAAHAAKENDLLLPALVGAGADLAALLADMHAALASGPAVAGEGS